MEFSELNSLDRQLSPALFDSGLIRLDDSVSTNNIDLLFSTAAVASIYTVRVADNNYHSDHVPVFGRLDAYPFFCRSSFNESNIGSLDWKLLNGKMEDQSLDLNW